MIKGREEGFGVMEGNGERFGAMEGCGERFHNKNLAVVKVN